MSNSQNPTDPSQARNPQDAREPSSTSSSPTSGNSEHKSNKLPKQNASQENSLFAKAKRLLGEPESNRRRWIMRSVRAGIVLVVLLFLGITLQRAWQDLQSNRFHERWNLVDLRWVAASVAMTMVAMLPAAIGWLQTLTSFRQTVPWHVGLHAYLLGHLGKYVPGKAMVLILRVGRIRPYGVEIKPAIVSVFVETLTSVGIGAILGASILIAMQPPWWIIGLSVGCIVCAAIPLIPEVFRTVIRIVSKSKVGRMPPHIAQAITWPMMIKTCSWMLIGWLLHGTACWFMLIGLVHEAELFTALSWLICVGAISLGAVAGFFSMLPGGAIVRELAITWLLATIVSHSDALGLAIVLRVSTLIAELLNVLIISIVKARLVRPSAN